MSIKDIMPNAVLQSKAGYPPAVNSPALLCCPRPPGCQSQDAVCPAVALGACNCPARAVDCCPVRGSCVLLSPRLVQGDVACCLVVVHPVLCYIVLGGLLPILDEARFQLLAK